MTSVILAQVTVAPNSGVSKDTVANTFHFTTEGTAVARDHTTDIRDAIKAFYNASVAPKISTYLSDQYAWTNARIRLYDLADGEPRAPYYDVHDTLGDPGSVTSLPSQVSCCLSYQGTPTSGLVQARRRGRLYIGPLNTNVVSSGDLTRPSGNFVTALLAAAAGLWASGGDTTWRWVVYSRQGTGQTTRPTQAWVDDRFDVQRRRAVIVTSRSSTTF